MNARLTDALCEDRRRAVETTSENELFQQLHDQTELTAQTEPISDFPDRSRAATPRAWLADRQTAKQLVPLPLIPTAGQCSADN